MYAKITEELTRSRAAEAIRQDGGRATTEAIDERVAASLRRRVVRLPYTPEGWKIVEIDVELRVKTAFKRAAGREAVFTECASATARLRECGRVLTACARHYRDENNDSQAAGADHHALLAYAQADVLDAAVRGAQ